MSVENKIGRLIEEAVNATQGKKYSAAEADALLTDVIKLGFGIGFGTDGGGNDMGNDYRRKLNEFRRKLDKNTFKYIFGDRIYKPNERVLHDQPSVYGDFFEMYYDFIDDDKVKDVDSIKEFLQYVKRYRDYHLTRESLMKGIKDE